MLVQLIKTEYIKSVAAQIDRKIWAASHSHARNGRVIIIFNIVMFITLFVIQSFIGIYYNIIIAWTIHYLSSSFTADLPWQHCDNDYNDQCKLCRGSNPVPDEETE